MAKTPRSTISGYWRCRGMGNIATTFLNEDDEKKQYTPSVAASCLSIYGIDATLNGTDIFTGYWLPPSTIPLRYEIFSESTGGTAPLVDVGVRIELAGTFFPIINALIDGAPVDANYSYELGDIGTAADASLGNVYSDSPAMITVSDGGGTNATGGTFDLHIWFVQDDIRPVGSSTKKGIALPSTTDGYLRNQGQSDSTFGQPSIVDVNDPSQPIAPGIVPCIMVIRGIDATLAGTSIRTDYYLPVNSEVLRVDIRGNGTGGTAPLVDVGLRVRRRDGVIVNSPNYYVDGAPVDSDSSIGLGDATAGIFIGLGNVFVIDGGVDNYNYWEVTVSDGGGTNATAGTFDLYIWYSFYDESEQNY